MNIDIASSGDTSCISIEDIDFTVTHVAGTTASRVSIITTSDGLDRIARAIRDHQGLWRFAFHTRPVEENDQ